MLAILLTPGIGRGQSASPSANQLKAAFVYHFAQFVEWPTGTFKDSHSPIIVGILGENPFGGELEKTLSGKRVNERLLEVQQFGSVSEATNACQILFINPPDHKQLPDIVKSLGNARILTIGDSEGFTEADGMIGFFMEGAKVRFRINDAAAKRVGLRISSKLLSLASRSGR